MHRKKATKKTKSNWIVMVGPDGKSTKRLVKKTTWQCDVGVNKGVVLKQTQLSFNKTKSVVVERGGDDRGGLSLENTTHFSSSTAGQTCVGDVRTEAELK